MSKQRADYNNGTHPNTGPDLEALAHKVVHYSAPCLASSTGHKYLHVYSRQHSPGLRQAVTSPSAP